MGVGRMLGGVELACDGTKGALVLTVYGSVQPWVFDGGELRVAVVLDGVGL